MPTTGLQFQRHALFSPCGATQAGIVGFERFFFHAAILDFAPDCASPSRPMTKRTAPGNPASAQPMPGLSLRAQALLKPVRNPVVIEPKDSGIARHFKARTSI